jgi:hypothetical protein
MVKEILVRSLIVVIIVLVILVAFLTYMIFYYRKRYQSIRSRNKGDQEHYSLHEDNIDDADELESVDDVDIDESKNENQELKEPVKKGRRKSSSLDFGPSDNVSEMTGDIELGRNETYPNDIDTNRNDWNLSKPTFISKWKKKVHKSSKNARQFIKRILMNSSENKRISNHYENSIKLSPTNSSIENSTKEEIVIPISMLPDITNAGIIRFPNSPTEPLTYLTLNTAEIERENNHQFEEFRLKSVRIINSPR